MSDSKDILSSSAATGTKVFQITIDERDVPLFLEALSALEEENVLEYPFELKLIAEH